MNPVGGEALHAGQPLGSAGAPLLEARAAMVVLHGRGDSAEGILGLTAELDVKRFAYLAPQAAGSAWYPQSFLAPLAANQPWLDSALRAVTAAVDTIAAAGLTGDRVILLGFSQGACLALEFAARNPRRYGGVAGLSGGLIGPPGNPWEYPGSLDVALCRTTSSTSSTSSSSATGRRSLPWVARRNE